jgi:Transposase DDE domain
MKQYNSKLSISEVMTITLAFDGSGFRTFKEFYPLQVQPHWDGACPHLVSYTRFVELMPWSLMGLLSFFNTCGGEMTGISSIDSTSMTFGLSSVIEVCHPNRARAHKVFNDLAGWGKSSVCWYFGFELHLIINERGEILSLILFRG